MKRRYTMIAVWESEIDPLDYFDNTVDPPRQMTKEEALKCDIAAIEDDPAAFLDNAKISVSVEDLS